MIPGSESHVERHRKAYVAVFAQQRDAVLGGGPLDQEQWNPILAEVMGAQAFRTVKSFGDEIALRHRFDWDPELLGEYLADFSRITAESTNATTAKALADVDEEGRGHVFDVLLGTRALQIARSKVGTEANLGRHEAASQGRLREKRWVVTSNRPRSSHARMSGQSVPIGENFSNGARWPGDPVLSIDDRAGCSCLVDFS